jgi:hypothetical protein
MDKKAAKRVKADYSAYKKPKLMKTAMSDSSGWRGPSNLDMPPELAQEDHSNDAFNPQDTDDYNQFNNDSHDGDDASAPVPEEETPAPEPTIVRANTIETSTIRTGKAGKKSKLSFLPKFEREAPALEPVLKKSDASGRQEWRDVIRESVETQPMATMSQDTFNLSNGSDLLEPDGSLQLFWFDALEKNGKVYLFGKVHTFFMNNFDIEILICTYKQAKVKSTGAYKSVCVTVENIKRNVFLLPRAYKLDGIPIASPFIILSY